MAASSASATRRCGPRPTRPCARRDEGHCVSPSDRASNAFWNMGMKMVSSWLDMETHAIVKRVREPLSRRLEVINMAASMDDVAHIYDYVEHVPVNKAYNKLKNLAVVGNNNMGLCLCSPGGQVFPAAPSAARAAARSNQPTTARACCRGGCLARPYANHDHELRPRATARASRFPRLQHFMVPSSSH